MLPISIFYTLFFECTKSSLINSTFGSRPALIVWLIFMFLHRLSTNWCKIIKVNRWVVSIIIIISFLFSFGSFEVVDLFLLLLSFNVFGWVGWNYFFSCAYLILCWIIFCMREWFLINPFCCKWVFLFVDWLKYIGYWFNYYLWISFFNWRDHELLPLIVRCVIKLCELMCIFLLNNRRLYKISNVLFLIPTLKWRVPTT